ncbi:MAG: hypothetical protein C6H99_01980 [Epsilonproteobacteria bacterium]|nr:hypothetical protein [Campylobacterota bacterium]NPA63851.1 hypothetical protein [Campylobacterota bacterium]
MKIAVVVLVSVGLMASDLPVAYDPFVIPKPSHTPRPKPTLPGSKPLRLYGIFDGKAFINGKFYRVGQRVAGAKIVQIKECCVILVRGRKKIVLPLRKETILQIGSVR